VANVPSMPRNAQILVGEAKVNAGL